MRSFYLTGDEKGNLSMDFLTAVAVILIAFIFALNVISSMITPYSGYSKELYPAADRAVTLLIENEGYWDSEYGDGTNWEDIWDSQNYSDVEKIGFLSHMSGNEKYLNSAIKSGEFLIEAQDADGAWRKSLSDYAGNQMPFYTYNTRTAWALCLLSSHVGNKCFKESNSLFDSFLRPTCTL